MSDQVKADADLPLHPLSASASVVQTIDAFPPADAFFEGKAFAEVCPPAVMWFEPPACEAYARPLGLRAGTSA